MDILEIIGLQIKTHIGVHSWEQKILQNLIIDIRLGFDCRNCQDDLNNTLDYDALCKSVTNLVEKQSFQLIETVATIVANFLKENYAITETTVSVSKPQAIKNAGNIRVTIKR